MFSMQFDQIHYAETHRGVLAVAPILKDNKIVGSITDYPERIVTPVRFATPAIEQEFIQAATDAGISNYGDEYKASEYARLLMTEAEQAYLAQQGA